MNDRSQEELLAFATDMAGAVVPAYVPLVAKHMAGPGSGFKGQGSGFWI
jgi:hypothetical protein